jgi:carbon storage regulator CsrA
MKDNVSSGGLVLTRQNGQAVLIGSNIRVVVYTPGRVKLGIQAPKDVRVLREELTRTEPTDDRREVQ